MNVEPCLATRHLLTDAVVSQFQCRQKLVVVAISGSVMKVRKFTPMQAQSISKTNLFSCV